MTYNPERVEMFRMVWGQLRVPVRPGVEGLQLYRKQMQSLTRRHILVLGATPELVDMAIDLGAERVVSIERNPDVIEAMRRLGEKDWNNVELIEGNWLEHRPEFVAAFDCIVCDGGLLFLEFPDQWSLLFSLVKSYLTPNGVFVAKEWAEPSGEHSYRETVDWLLQEFDQKLADASREERLEGYRILTSELRLAAFINATCDDCSFNQGLLVTRLDSLLAELEKRCPEPEYVAIAEGALRHLARSQAGTTDTVAGAHFDKANELLLASGFNSEFFPLPDRPVAAGNYMFVSKKLSHTEI